MGWRSGLIIGVATLALATVTASAVLAAEDGAAPAAPKFVVIHAFTGASADGWMPRGKLALYKDGLYGTTQWGGPDCPSGQYSCGGVVYRLAPPKKAGDVWPYEVITSFRGGKDGANPVSGLQIDKRGILYGSTQYGGVDCVEEPHHWGCGTVFKLQPPTSDASKWTRQVLYRFKGENDGRFPISPPQEYAPDVLYGTTPEGGRAAVGIAYRLTAPDKKIGARIAPADLQALLQSPAAPMSRQAFPDLGGRGGFVEWLLEKIFKFVLSTLGGIPQAPVICPENASYKEGSGCTCFYGHPHPIDGLCPSIGHFEVPSLPSLASAKKPGFRGHGSLYGVASTAGDDDCVQSVLGCGVVYELKPKSGGKLNSGAGGGFSYHVRHSFLGMPDGYWPIGPLAIGPDGALYGTTLWGGKSCPAEPDKGCGTVFRVMPPHGDVKDWTETILYRFAGKDDGARPAGGVLLGPGGVLYGATTYGGGCSFDETQGCGTIFKLTPPKDPDDTWDGTVLHRFQNGADSRWPDGPLTVDAEGRIYGTAQWVVFQIKP